MFEGEEPTFEESPPEEASNRTFLVAAGILGGIVLIAIACLAGYLLFFRGNNGGDVVVDAGATTNAQINAALTATMQAQLSMPSATATPTETAVFQHTFTPTSIPFLTNTPDPSTATIAAGLTQVANAKLTVVPTGTRLPGQLANSGFLDDYGVPGMVVMGLAFILVIMFARRMRAAPVRK